MTTLYKRHDVTTIAEVNTLALTDNQENGSLVLGPYNETCFWSLPYAIRNEPTTTGHWSYQDGLGGSSLIDGDKVTVLVPIEAEETRDEGTGWIVPTAFGPKLMGAYLGSPDDTPAKRYTQTIWRTHWTPTEEA